MTNAVHVMVAILFWLFLSMREGTEPAVAFVGAGFVALFTYLWCRFVDWVIP